MISQVWAKLFKLAIIVSNVISPWLVNPSKVSLTKASISLLCLSDESGDWKDMRSGISWTSMFISTTMRASHIEGEAAIPCPVPYSGSKVVLW